MDTAGSVLPDVVKSNKNMVGSLRSGRDQHNKMKGQLGCSLMFKKAL